MSMPSFMAPMARSKSPSLESPSQTIFELSRSRLGVEEELREGDMEDRRASWMVMKSAIIAWDGSRWRER